MKKGFTLIELMAVITILFLMTIAVVPSIIKQISEKKEDINNTTLNLIYNATDLYVSSDKNTYKKEMGNVYCVTLNTLVQNELLNKKITNFTTGKQIPLNRVVKVMVNSYYEFEYELLDGNASCEENIGIALADAASVGDYVAYDAGTWTESKEIPTTNGEFGGYTNGKNKASSVSYCSNEEYKISLQGFRILSIDKDKKTVTLIHAGIPECYYHHGTDNSASSLTQLEKRASEYLNSDYASSTHILNYSSDKTTIENVNNTTSDLINIGITSESSSPYWLATSYSSNNLYFVNNKGIVENSVGYAYGIRPVIVLKDNIKTTGKKKDVLGQTAWTLIK